jgi:hypothetical protein
MDQQKLKKLRFSDAVNAIESTPKALRKMLQNPGLVLPVPVSDGWKEFSLVQIAVLTIARRLIEFGFSVESASRNACSALFESILGTSAAIDDDFTAETFLRSICDAYAIAYFDEGQLTVVVKREAQWPAMLHSFQKRPVLVIPIGAVVKRAFERVLLGAEGDMSGSADSLLYGLKEFRFKFAVSEDELRALIAEAEKIANG